MLKKDAATSWTEDCQKAFDKIKEYMSTPPVLIPSEPGRPLLLYLSVLYGAFSYGLGQHDETGRKEQAIYYLSKKFTPYEARSEIEELLLCLYHIPHIRDGSSEKTIKGQVLADHLAENLVGGEHEPLKTYFPDEEVSFIGEDIAEAYDDWRLFFDGATNFKGVGIGSILVSKTSQHYPVSAKLRFPCTNNMAEYDACILGFNFAIDMNV
ncbi:uncharacterized protein [Nicotiana sylvestris]|uniref:uncharacterized protein n=1 Tax=Nicotiana sylvestris TaxID=4096 RepID=UPI00388CB213